jgi:hypothetical protein
VDGEAAKRATARALAAAALQRGDPTGWFEELYAGAAQAGEVPWADLVPNPMMVAWLEREGVIGDGRRALKVGAGLGDDADPHLRRVSDAMRNGVDARCRASLPSLPLRDHPRGTATVTRLRGRKRVPPRA